MTLAEMIFAQGCQINQPVQKQMTTEQRRAAFVLACQQEHAACKENGKLYCDDEFWRMD